MNTMDRVLADGANSDYIFGGKGSTFLPVKTDCLLHEHDTVRLSDMRIAVLHHPGHTRGRLQLLYSTLRTKTVLPVLIANMPHHPGRNKALGMPGYPDVG